MNDWPHFGLIMMPSHHHNLQFELFYCYEECWDCVNLRNLIPREGENEELSFLLSKEEEIEVGFGITEARVEAVEWILNVTRFYSFSALTAVLAVSYFDRFIHKFRSHNEKPWMIQLAAVASLSLAAKVEETRVPLLSDLQVEESMYVFESKTIQRMEVLMLSTLEWKMNDVTALSLIDYIARSRLALDGNFCIEFLRKCECLVLSVLSDCRFINYLPSTLATATVLYAIGVDCHDKLAGILGANKGKVEECCKMIEDNKGKFGSNTGSPKGVVDVYFSSSDSSSPEPVSKRIKPSRGIF